MASAFRVILLHVAFFLDSPTRMLICLAMVTAVASGVRAYEGSTDQFASVPDAYTIRTPRRASQDDLLHFKPNISSFDGNRYQWYLNNVAIDGATNLIYVTPPLREEHLGEYTLIMTNRIGSVTNRALVQGFLTNNAMRFIGGYKFHSDAVESDAARNIYVVHRAPGDSFTTFSKFSHEGSLIWSNQFQGSWHKPFVTTENGAGYFPLQFPGGRLLRFSPEGKTNIIELGTSISTMARAPGGLVVAFSATNGSFISGIDLEGYVVWRHSVPFLPIALDARHPTTLAIGADSRVILLTASAGIRWERNLPSNFQVQAVRVGSDASAYVMAASGTNRFFVKLSHDGRQEWITSTDAYSWGPYSTPHFEVDGSGALYFVGRAGRGVMCVTRLSEDGRLGWRAPFRPWVDDGFGTDARLLVPEDFWSKTNEPIYLVYNGSYATAPWGGFPGGHGVLAKFDTRGLRRWERILPRYVSIGAEGGRRITDLTMVGQRAIALVGSGETTGFPIAFVEDLEASELSSISAESQISVTGGAIVLTTIVHGTDSSHTNVWRDLNKNPSYLDSTPIVITNHLAVPFTLMPTNYFVEIDLPDATLGLPLIEFNAFAAFSNLRLAGAQLELKTETLPSLQFRCLVSEDLRTWTELTEPVRSDAEGRVQIPADVSASRRTFYRLVRP